MGRGSDGVRLAAPPEGVKGDAKPGIVGQAIPTEGVAGLSPAYVCRNVHVAVAAKELFPDAATRIMRHAGWRNLGETLAPR